MDSKNFDLTLENYLLEKNDPKRKSWEILAKNLGYFNGESLRKQFKRELAKREHKGNNSNFSSGASTKQSETARKDGTEPVENTTYQEGDGYINIICSSPRIITKDDVIKHFNIDTNIWKVKEFTVKSSEGYRRDRSVQWEVENGMVISGKVNDSGKILVVPMFHTETKLVRKTFDEFIDEKFIDKIFENLKIKNPESIKIKPQNRAINGKVLVVPIADLHLGLLATEKSVGNNYNLEVAETLYYQVLGEIRERIGDQPVEEILFIVGNDFLNSDNVSGSTTKGTPQDNVSFWYELFDKALEMIIGGIDLLLEVSKVTVINATSNHDHQSLYAIMKAVQYYFKDNRDVQVDTSCLPRKYYRFGKNVIGIAHDMQIKKALELMSTEAKSDWSECNNFIWLLAHLHNSMQYEHQGKVEIYRLPTVSGLSRWANNSGYLQVERKSQAFILDDENGIETVMNIVV